VFPTEPAADPLSDWLESCARLKGQLAADVLVLPAHNEPFTGVHHRLQELMDGHERSLDQVERQLREGPRRAVDLFPALFPRQISGELLGFATGESLAHLNCLIHRGRVRQTTTAEGIWLYEAV
jgi:glyoxylase-like metal-dependent hydrolase (beta-lactamase superfamily II)